MIDKKSSNEYEILNNYKEESYIIAYLDIMGARSNFCSNKEEYKDEYIRFMLGVINKFYEKTQDNKQLLFYTFSDNIAICVPSKDFSHNFRLLLEMVSFLQSKVLLYKGILLRGSITFGVIYPNKYSLIGEGLLRAINIEEHEAIYPRVIIDKVLYGLISSIEDLNDMKQYFCKDIDGKYYVDFYKYVINDKDYANLDKNCLLNNAINYYDEERKKNDELNKKLSWIIGYLQRCYSKE